MSILRMHVVPDPMLRQKAKRVSAITPSIEKLVDDMVETMHEAHGVGLAANQVGVLQRVIVIHMPEEEEPRVFINPQIVRRQGERDMEEGCLSIPGYRGLVRRSETVRVRGLDQNGRLVRVNADELLAQALEHEIDHLNGILYIDRLVARDKIWKEEPEEPAENSEECVAAEAGYTG